MHVTQWDSLFALTKDKYFCGYRVFIGILIAINGITVSKMIVLKLFFLADISFNQINVNKRFQII